jgi:hypothetical protein
VKIILRRHSILAIQKNMMVTLMCTIMVITPTMNLKIMIAENNI